MSIKQLSIFVENREGAMSKIMQVLASYRVDIRALSIADTTDFGILRLVVEDTEKAVCALHAENIIVSVTSIVGVVIPDEAGSLAKVLKVLAEGMINIEYMYSFLTVLEGKALIAIKVADTDATTKLLNQSGIDTLEEDTEF